MNKKNYGRMNFFLPIKSNFAERELISATGKIWKDNYVYKNILNLLEEKRALNGAAIQKNAMNPLTEVDTAIPVQA